MLASSRSALITVRALADALRRPEPPVVLDVRWKVGEPSQRAAYLAGHIPGAQWVDLDDDLADPPGRAGRHPLPDPARLQRRMREWGIDSGRAVVAYDGAESVAAARAWWVLMWAGLARVSVLDGGFRAWSVDDQPVEQQQRLPPAGDVTVVPGGLPTVDSAAVANFAARHRLVDVRSPERFAGWVEPMDPVAGRIPGAVNLPTTDNVDVEGRFRARAWLARRWREAGLVDPEVAGGSTAGRDADPVAVYCGSGVTAAHTILAMHESGMSGVLYPGSWSEWITDPSRPVATG
jgi:thiosulfate/3-mercaptopyruvate sulfurtransferase